MTEKQARRIATKILDSFKIKHPKIFEELFKKILEKGREISVHIRWDSSAQDIKMEIIE